MLCFVTVVPPHRSKNINLHSYCAAWCSYQSLAPLNMMDLIKTFNSKRYAHCSRSFQVQGVLNSSVENI